MKMLLLTGRQMIRAVSTAFSDNSACGIGWRYSSCVCISAYMKRPSGQVIMRQIASAPKSAE